MGTTRSDWIESFPERIRPPHNCTLPTLINPNPSFESHRTDTHIPVEVVNFDIVHSSLQDNKKCVVLDVSCDSGETCSRGNSKAPVSAVRRRSPSIDSQ
jgi:hypothetical protein